MIFNLSFWVFEIFLVFFKIDEVIVKFLGGFCENALISSCIESHVHYHYIFMHLDVCYMC